MTFLRVVNARIGKSASGRSKIGRLVVALLLCASLTYGYTVLTHLAIIDSVWDVSLEKLLLKRFPNSTPEELKQAHAYAYGGCIIQDMGYYPFSSRFFSDLTHYVRSGDFIAYLIRESQDLNEYAFALGALEHYAADTEGHRIGTNRAVPILFPKLEQKYGNDVTYWDNPTAHVRTEFGFDVLQVAAGRYPSEHYRSFIGFKVSKDLLERAFRDTYDLEMKDVFGNVNRAIGSYRYAVRSIVPTMTKVAWSLKQKQLQQEIPGMTRQKFLYNLSRASYEKEWGTEYQRPGIGAEVLAFVVRIMPAWGPFAALKIRTPTPEVEKMFMASFNATIDRYKAMLVSVDPGRPAVPNENFDVGGVSHPGEYKGTDEAYAKLVGKLADHEFANMTPDLRRNILAFYKDFKPRVDAKGSKKGRAESAKLIAQLDRLRAEGESTR